MVETVIFLILCFVGMIVYFRLKNRWQDNHPKQCSICGKEHPHTYALKDGRICDGCCHISYKGGSINITDYMNSINLKLTSVDEINNYAKELKERGELMTSFNPTRVSPSGKIQADDTLGLFVIRGKGSYNFAHRISDIESFRLVIDKDNNSGDVPLVTGGHIAIKISEPIKEITFELGVEDKLVGMKHEVKKTFEDDLVFLEELTGMKRKLTSDLL